MLLLAVLAAPLGGCLHLGYLAQAAYGQDEIAYLARPLDEAVDDPSMPGRTRAMLSIIEDVKGYAERHGLEVTGSYRAFARLDRPVAVWVVSASPPLRFEPLTWTFPIVGSVPYLGWFNHRDAVRFARELSQQGLDVHLRGAGAYSTLGWFDDPVLSSMIGPEEHDLGDLINVVLHESVHATLYVPDQSTFNESLASFVADTLTLSYLRERLGRSPRQVRAYIHMQRERDQRDKRMHEAFVRMDKLYASAKPDAEKLRIKAEMLDELQVDLDLGWPINNATLEQSRTYNAVTPLFAELLTQSCDGDWQRFWRAILTIGEGDFVKPQQDDAEPVLRPLIKAGCSRKKI